MGLFSKPVISEIRPLLLTGFRFQLGLERPAGVSDPEARRRRHEARRIRSSQRIFHSSKVTQHADVEKLAGSRLTFLWGSSGLIDDVGLCPGGFVQLLYRTFLQGHDPGRQGERPFRSLRIRKIAVHIGAGQCNNERTVAVYAPKLLDTIRATVSV